MTTPNPASTSDRQLPVLRGYAAEFYGWCQQHELRFQRCARCKTWRHPPRPLCSQCHGFEAEWAPVSGLGRLHAWTVPMAPIGTAFASEMPYVAAIVALDEGPRMASWVTGVAPADLRADMRLRVWFDAVTPEVTLAKFRPPD